ncbi:hypothetical protein D3C81_821770 [compost metagenome]
MRPGHPVMLANMIDRSHAIALGIDLARLVGNHGIVCPAAFPEFVDHIEKFVCAFIAIIVLDHLLQAEVASGAGQVGGDDVPADPAIGQVVQRAEAPGMGERMLVTGGHSDAEGEVFRHGGQCRNDHQRIVGRCFHRPLHGRVGITAKHIVETQHITKKQHVEMSLVGDACQVRPVAQRVDGQSLVSRVRPEARRAATANAGLLV